MDKIGFDGVISCPFNKIIWLWMNGLNHGRNTLYIIIDELHDLVLANGQVGVSELALTDVEDERYVYSHLSNRDVSLSENSGRVFSLFCDSKMCFICWKVLMSVFSDAKGILFTEYWKSGITITGEYYACLLSKWKVAITQAHPRDTKKGVFSPQRCAGAFKPCCPAKVYWAAVKIALAYCLFTRFSSFGFSAFP